MIRQVVAVFDTQHGGRWGVAYQDAYSERDVATRWRSDAFDAIEACLCLRCEDGWTFIDDLFAGELDKYDIEELELVDEDGGEDSITLLWMGL